MNRRDSLAVLLGKKKKATNSIKAAPVTNTFSPYTGTWGYEQAAHLLRRTTFGPTSAEIKQAVTDGLDATINKLFQDLPPLDEPIYFSDNNDPLVGLGESWVPYPETDGIGGIRNARRSSLYGWTFKSFWDAGVNITEKMTLFWHNHFVVASTNNPIQLYQYWKTLRDNALGNFQTLVEEVTINPGMLRYLNGTQNTKNAPNENYSRELLELFTIGKGPAAGPGDYTNYTEDDVIELARALTGWRFFTNNTDVYLEQIQSSFVPNRHDEGDKQLSHRFNNAIISNEGENEYKTVIDIIFQQEEVARFISRKLYVWFVGSDIHSDIETNIIEPMAQQLIADGYNIKPALMGLLSSEHFYDTSMRGCMISHPIDFFYTLVRTLQTNLPTDLYEQYGMFNLFFRGLSGTQLGMNIFDHPSVAGWKAFYQAPQYYKIWINSVSLPDRMNLSDNYVEGVDVFGLFIFKIDVLGIIASFDNPAVADDMITELAQLVFAQPITDSQKDNLKSIHGISDVEWQNEYTDYVSGNNSLEEAIENKLKSLFTTMLKMPEFYLM